MRPFVQKKSSASQRKNENKIMDNPSGFPLLEHTHTIRVRYSETDAQGHVHHTAFINYFEIGRLEMLRAAGHSFHRLAEEGLLLVVSEVHCQLFLPALFDDLLKIRTHVLRSKGVRIKHEYEITRGEALVATGWSVVASVGKDGKVRRLPNWLKLG